MKVSPKVDVPQNEGSLRVWHIPQVPGEAFRVPVDTVEAGRKLLEILADYDIFQFEHHIKPDYANVSGLEVLDGGEWVEWSDPVTGDEVWAEP